MSFWNNLKKPFFVMAPMADVTDVAFRALVAKRGAPDVFWTEFVSADGLYHTREIQKMSDAENPLMRDLIIGEGQRPIVAQIFSNKPEMIAYATKLVAELGFDGVDLNMGCPDRSIEKQGAGAALVKNPALAVELIRAAKEASGLPVSVKTRIGYNKESLDEWLKVLLSANPAAITLHLRTRKDMSLVPADWELMKRAVELRDRVNPNVLLIGNGDIKDLKDAKIKIEESGCDGVMLGRAMFGNPWVFAGRESEDTPLVEKLAALVELAHDFEKIVPAKSFAILKKHIKAFVTGFAGAAELRAHLMQAESAAELERIVLDATKL
ncbi:MAG: tRNA-dihydrouridine synthase [Candidatus Parcubacteria bacterium]|nr:tRNA-dihydrouridine synthase [Candidatus Parcubacteria bacterium]